MTNTKGTIICTTFNNVSYVDKPKTIGCLIARGFSLNDIIIQRVSSISYNIIAYKHS